MDKTWSRLFPTFERLLVPIGAILTVVAAYFAFTHVWTSGKLTVIAALGIVAWASWSGYRQNRGLNGEWPINLAILAASSVGILGLVISFFV